MALIVAALLAAGPQGGLAQDRDLLASEPGTSIYVETAYDGNDGLADCDWYATADEMLRETGAAGRAHGCSIVIRIRGMVTRAGARQFADIVDRIEARDLVPVALVLDSRGGDADAAIAIGRSVRESAAFLLVPVETRLADSQSAVCFSACVVIFAAGYRRSLEFDIGGNRALPSRIGIHGPGQFDSRERRYDTSSGNLDIARIGRRLRDYFASVGVSTSLVDAMFSVPFDEIRLLGRSELIEYGLYVD